MNRSRDVPVMSCNDHDIHGHYVHAEPRSKFLGGGGGGGAREVVRMQLYSKTCQGDHSDKATTRIRARSDWRKKPAECKSCQGESLT